MKTKKRRLRPDPLIDEVRAVRKALGDRFGNDVERLGEYLQRFGDAYRKRSSRASRSAGVLRSTRR